MRFCSANLTASTFLGSEGKAEELLCTDVWFKRPASEEASTEKGLMEGVDRTAGELVPAHGVTLARAAAVARKECAADPGILLFLEADPSDGKLLALEGLAVLLGPGFIPRYPLPEAAARSTFAHTFRLDAVAWFFTLRT